MSVLKSIFCNNLLKNAIVKPFELANTRTLKSALKIKWVRPVKKPHIHPENTGDGSSITKYPKGTFMLSFEGSKELETADDNVKKIFQLDMQPTIPKYLRYKNELVAKVKRHPYDHNSHEVFVATLTAKIRYLQEQFEKNPKNIKSKVKLQHLIDRRKTQLTHLRRWDYPRFEWILEKLDIFYKPYPSVYDKVTRKKSMQQLTTIHCEEIKEKKIAEYRKKMDSLKVPFLEKKLQQLQNIRQQEKEFNLPSTVREDEVKECEEQLQRMRLEVRELEKRTYRRTIHPYTLEKYDPEELLKAENKIHDE